MQKAYSLSEELHPWKKIRSEFIIFLVWIIIQAALVWKNGIVTDGESEKYISQARLLTAEGHLSNGSYFMYLTQILLIAVAKLAGLGYVAVVFVQLVLSLVATIIYFKFTKQLLSSGSLAMTGTLIFLLNIPLQEFNSFLQTESIFYSLGIITSCFVLKQPLFNLKKLAVVLMLLILLSITRPTGILFVPPVLLYIFFRFASHISVRKKLIIVAAGTTIFIFLLNAALGSGGELDFMLPYRAEQIICGVPTLPGFTKIDERFNGNSVFGLTYYVFHNFPQFLRLAWFRSLAFFGLVRTYYSSFHNVLLVLYFYVIYVLLITSFKFWIKRFPNILFFVLFLTLMFWGTVSLSCDDWHNRFFLTLSPYLLILGLPAIRRMVITKEKNTS